MGRDKGGQKEEGEDMIGWVILDIYFDVWLHFSFLIKVLFDCTTALTVSKFIINTSDLAGVTHPFSRSPGRNGVASTSGDYWRKPGRICHYDNGVNGTCLPKEACLKEQEDLTGHNGTWRCPYHKSAYRMNRYCCPFPGEENLLPGEESTLSNSKKLC